MRRLYEVEFDDQNDEGVFLSFGNTPSDSYKNEVNGVYFLGSLAFAAAATTPPIAKSAIALGNTIN